MNLEDALDKLYAAPIEEFTSTRNALATELKGADAQTIKSLKKPNLAAWAVNQLARKHSDVVEELFAVTDKLRHAQRRLMSGGKASELRKATDERNKVITRLTKLAEQVLTDAGHGAAASTLSAVGDSFIAVAGDDEAAELLRKGHLSRELEPSAFIDVGGLKLVESLDDDEAPEPDDRSAVEEARKAVSEARVALKEARDVHKKAVAEANELSLEADEAERLARKARQEAEFARRAADGRQADVEEAEKAVARAQKELKELD